MPQRPSGFKAETDGFVESMNSPACCCYWLNQSYEATRHHFYFQTEVDFSPKGPKTKDPSLGFRKQNNPDQQIPQVWETLKIGTHHLESQRNPEEHLTSFLSKTGECEGNIAGSGVWHSVSPSSAISLLYVLGQITSHAKPQFPYPQNGDKDGPYF